MRPTSSSLALCLGIALAACSTPGDAALPSQLVRLYDEAAPAGLLEIEADRNGTILELEAEIPTSALPEAVVAAAREQLPGAEIVGAEHEFVGDLEGYEVKMRSDGVDYELVLDLDGVLLEKEVAMEPADAPSAVMEGARAAVSGGELKSVERVERTGETEYHVKFQRDGASYKVVLRPDGSVLRRVREARAELEIPLPASFR